MGVPIALTQPTGAPRPGGGCRPGRSEKRGLLGAFGVFGLFWGSWVVVIPDVQNRAGVGDGALGLALAAVAVCALPAMPLAGRLVDRHGAHRVLPFALLAFAAVAALPGLAVGPLSLVLVLAALGAGTGFLDVVVNTATAAWERIEQDRLMAAAHGTYSLGVLIGSVLTGLARDAGAGPLAVLGVTGTALAVAGLRQPAYRRATQDPVVGAGRPAGRRWRIAPLLLGLGLVTAMAFLVEDSVQSWSALHLERSLAADPWVQGLGPGLFAGAMAAGRFAVHVVHRPGREAQVVAGGAGVLAAGVLVLALAPVTWVSLLGMAVAGAGVSVLAPTLFSATGARSAPGRQGADLALVTTFGYAGFLAGPVVVGLLSSATTLPTALALLSGLAVAVAVAGPMLLHRHPIRADQPGPVDPAGPLAVGGGLPRG